MSFEKPERLLTQEEWVVLADAAQDKAGDYRVISGAAFREGERKLSLYYAKKADKISRVLINLEEEYYKKHPDEDPDKKGNK